MILNIKRVENLYIVVVGKLFRYAKIINITITSILVLFICFVLFLTIINADASDNDITLRGFRFLIYAGVVVTAGILFISVINRVQLHYLFLVVAMGIGLVYMFTMTPFSIPDEAIHFHRSLNISAVVAGARESDFDFSGTALHFNVPYSYIRLMTEGIRTIASDSIVPNPVFDGYVYYPIQYFPQAIGVSIARLFQLNFLGIFYLGRFFNLLFYVLCVFFAIRSVNDFKLPIFIVGILPMALHQAASFSNDAFINGVSILFIAYLIRCIYEKDEWDFKDIAVLAAAGILLAPVKVVYFLITLILFFAAPFKFGFKNAKGYVMAGVICTLGLIMLILFNFASLSYAIAPNLDAERWHGGTNYTLSFVFEYPIQAVMLFVNTFREFGSVYFFGTFGLYLSGQTITVRFLYIAVFVLLFGASVFHGKKDGWIPTIPQKGLYFAVFCAVVLMTLLGMMQAWTPDTSSVIHGVQGRYFVPLLPLALLILRTKLKIDRSIFSYAIIGAAFFLHFMIIRHVLYYTIS